MRFSLSLVAAILPLLWFAPEVGAAPFDVTITTTRTGGAGTAFLSGHSTLGNVPWGIGSSIETEFSVESTAETGTIVGGGRTL